MTSPGTELGKAVPYGVYDIAANAGWVNVGTDHDTAAFAVESIRRWWNAAGQRRLPAGPAAADHRGRGRLQRLPHPRVEEPSWPRWPLETGLEITCCHFPPGTQCRCLSAANYRFVNRQPRGMMLDMHPWTGLSDDVRLGVLTEWVTAELVDEVLAECGKRDRKPGALPARFMVYYVLALALFQQDSYDDVAENLVGALEGMDEAIPNKSSFTRARQRLGAGVIEAVFRRLAGPVAPAGLDGAFWRGMRVAAVDGFVLDVPDTPVNRAAFGGPVDAKGQAAGFPQARVVTLTETGTHSSIDASVGGFRTGEPELAIAMAGSAAGMLVIMDRGFPGVALWKAYTQAEAHLLIRARSSVARRPVKVLDDGTYLARMNLAGQKGAHPGGVVVRVIEYRVDGGEVVRLLTDLMDPMAFPAAELAALYHQRWESESSFRQVKTFQRGPQEILRSADPELVRQEVWAHLAVHHCMTRIIMRLAAQERIDPDRISFVKVLKHVRRSVIRQCRTDIRADQAVHGDDGREGPPQARQRRQAPAARPTGPSSARPRSTPSARQARSAVLPAGWPPRCSHSNPR